MELNRRKFFAHAVGFGALLPPMPPGMHTLRSPKDTEHVSSLKKVSVQTYSPAAAIPAGLRITSISINGSDVTLNWVDGTGPFMIEQSDLQGEWEPVGTLTMARTQTIISASPEAFFRIHDAVPFPLTATDETDGVHLSWTPPTF